MKKVFISGEGAGSRAPRILVSPHRFYAMQIAFALAAFGQGISKNTDLEEESNCTELQQIKLKKLKPGQIAFQVIDGDYIKRLEIENYDPDAKTIVLARSMKKAIIKARKRFPEKIA